MPNAGFLAQIWRKNSWRKLCARILGANFAQGFLAQTLRKNSWRKFCTKFRGRDVAGKLPVPSMSGGDPTRVAQDSWRKFGARILGTNFALEFLAQFLRKSSWRKLCARFLAQILRKIYQRGVGSPSQDKGGANGGRPRLHRAFRTAGEAAKNLAGISPAVRAQCVCVCVDHTSVHASSLVGRRHRDGECGRRHAHGSEECSLASSLHPR